jgi:hypothetical protein
MNIDLLLSRFQKVKHTGKQTWLACCPAHDDQSPSLSIREKDDGLILLHCFTGCEVGDILAAIDLNIDALFPDVLNPCKSPDRRPFPAADVLRAIAFEALVVQASAVSMLTGVFSGKDRERLSVAVARIQAALDAAGVNRG